MEIPGRQAVSRIFLIGMPGAGKTFWGEKLSRTYGIAFTDLDQYIEAKEGRSVAEIFSRDGEAVFRAKEAASLAEIIDIIPTPLLLAAGGGTPMFGSNMDIMKRSGTVVYLRASIETLLTHLEHTNIVRPLLASGDARQNLSHLLEKRKEVYEKADLILDVETISVATFAQIIATCTGEPL